MGARILLHGLLLSRPAFIAACAIFMVIATPGVVLARSAGERVGNTLLLALVIGAPAALRIETLAALWQHRYLLGGTVIAATFAWDVWTALALGRRSVFDEWPLVYASALLTFALIYAAQTSLTHRIHRRADCTRARSMESNCGAGSRTRSRGPQK